MKHRISPHHQASNVSCNFFLNSVTYTNDNTDKKQRQQKRFLRVYLIPLLVIAGTCVLNYGLTDSFNLDKRDQTTGYVISVTLGIVVWFLNKSRFLPIGDGSYFHINDHQKQSETKIISHLNEPLQYEAEFRNSLTDQFILLICGIVAIVFGSRITKNNSIIFPFLIVSLGIFTLIAGFKGLIDRKPKLKLSTKGLWTRKLGFQPWTAIKKTQIVKEESSRLTQVYLEIYLKNSEFAEADYPDERFSFYGIGKSSKIESSIDQLKYT